MAYSALHCTLLFGCEFAEGHFLVVWDEDSSMSVISGKLMVTPSIVGERTVGSTCNVETSPRGPPHSARIAGCGEGTL